MSARGAVALGSACALWAALALPAQAEVLRDPTRPPAELESAAQGSLAEADVGPRLQSVLISPTRRVAVISGQTVMLGEDFGGARLVKISENEVVLRKGNTTQTLRLFTGIEKTRRHANTLAAKAGGRDKIRD